MQLAFFTYSNAQKAKSVKTLGVCGQAIALASGDQTGIALPDEWAVCTAETMRQGEWRETDAAWTEAGIETPVGHDRHRQPHRAGRTIPIFSFGSSPARYWWRRHRHQDQDRLDRLALRRDGGLVVGNCAFSRGTW